MSKTKEKGLVIVGASGHGKVIVDIAKLNGYRDIVFLDDNENLKECSGYPILGKVDMLREVKGDVFVAVGDSSVRSRIIKKYPEKKFPTLIHPNSIIADDVVIGEGSVIMAGAVVNPSARIGKGCIVNTSSSIDHDCSIGDYVHIAVGAHVCGTVSIGDFCWIGAGATISNNVSICSSTIIGAGATVIKDIKENGTYVGVPAKIFH